MALTYVPWYKLIKIRQKKKNIGGCLSASLFAEGYGEYRLVREKH